MDLAEVCLCDWSFEVLKMTLARQNWMSMPGLSGREYHRAKELLGTGRKV